MTKTEALTMLDHARNALARSSVNEIDQLGITFNWRTEAARQPHGNYFDGAVVEIAGDDGAEIVVRLPMSLAEQKTSRTKAK